MDTSRELSNCARLLGTMKANVGDSDKVGNKPWGDASLTAPAEFWNASSQWGSTWGPPEDRGMTVKSVKMYSQGTCGSPS